MGVWEISNSPDQPLNKDWNNKNNRKFVGEKIAIHKDGIEFSQQQCKSDSISWFGSLIDVEEPAHLLPPSNMPSKFSKKVTIIFNDCMSNNVELDLASESIFSSSFVLYFSDEEVMPAIQLLNGPTLLLKSNKNPSLLVTDFSPEIRGKIPQELINTWKLFRSFSIGISPTNIVPVEKLLDRTLEIKPRSFEVLNTQCSFNKPSHWQGDTIEHNLVKHIKSVKPTEYFYKYHYSFNPMIDEDLNDQQSLLQAICKATFGKSFQSSQHSFFSYEPLHGPKYLLKAMQ